MVAVEPKNYIQSQGKGNFNSQQIPVMKIAYIIFPFYSQIVNETISRSLFVMIALLLHTKLTSIAQEETPSPSVYTS